MRFSKLYSIFILLAAICLAGCSSSPIELTISNDMDFDRNEEMVEVEMSTLAELPRQFVVLDAENNQVPYQVTYDGKLIFLASVPANGSVVYKVKAGKPQDFQTIACGQVYPERVDDVAWENDKAAFRAYGPALQKNNERAFGYDVFTKRGTKDPVVAARYALELNNELRKQIGELRRSGQRLLADSLSNAISYHIDHGNGMDDYSVGATLGGGTSALLDEGNIVYPWAYKTCDILDNGPLRFTMKLDYNPFAIQDDNNIVESRIISFDAGSYMNKAQIAFNNLSSAKEVVAGLVIHPNNPEGYAFDKEAGYIAYADLTDHPDRDQGSIFVGAAFPNPLKDAKVQLFTDEEKDDHKGALGHVLGVSDYQPKATFTYYFGSGWSKADMPSMDAWTKYLKDFVVKANHPLTVNVK